MNSEELVEFQAEFKTINRKSKAQLRKWFLDYPELTIHEQSLITGMSQRWINTKRSSLKLTRTTIVELKSGVVIFKPRRCKKQILIPDGDLEEWIVDQVVNKKRSIKELSKAVNRSRNHVRRVLKDYCIVNKTETHPCKTREWVTEHFITKKLSLRECAEIAGVSHCTISGWLTHFGISGRDQYEAARGVLGKTINKPTNPLPPRR